MEKLEKNYNIEVQWTYFPLHPEIPEDGISLEELFIGRGYDIPSIQSHLKYLMDEEGLPFNPDIHMTYNSRLAQELAKWGDPMTGREKLHREIYRAYFNDGINIGKIDNLVGVAGKAGFPIKEAENILDRRDMKGQVDDDWETSRGSGVTGVPTFMVNRSRVVGSQPYDELSMFLERNGADKREESG